MTTFGPVQVVAGTNDGYVTDDNVVFNNTLSRLIMNESSDTPPLKRVTFMIWDNVTIAKDSVIDSVDLSLFIYPGLTDVDVTIKAAKVANATAPTQASDVNDLTFTTASVVWSDTVTDNAYVSTPDIKTVIQEIVSQDDWVSGNSIMIITESEGYGADFAVLSFEAAGAARAQNLTIEYSDPPAPPPEQTDTIDGSINYAYAPSYKAKRKQNILDVRDTVKVSPRYFDIGPMGPTSSSSHPIKGLQTIADLTGVQTAAEGVEISVSGTTNTAGFGANYMTNIHVFAISGTTGDATDFPREQLFHITSLRQAAAASVPESKTSVFVPCTDLTNIVIGCLPLSSQTALEAALPANDFFSRFVVKIT